MLSIVTSKLKMYQSAIFDEFQFPFITISILIGYQISLYFFSQYLKHRSKQIEFNSILLAYTLFFGSSMTGLLIRTIINHFTLAEDVELLLFRFIYFHFTIGIISFLLVISVKSFENLTNPTIPRIILLLSIVPLITVFIHPPSADFYLYPLVIIFIGFLYIIFFQFKLSQLSTGEIKRRLKLIFMGECFMLLAIIFGSEGIRTRFFQAFSDMLVVIFIPVLILGLLLIFLGQYRFPAFFEFGWKENLEKFMVIDQIDNQILYSFDFNSKERYNNDNLNESTKSEKFISSAISGIEEIVSKSIQRNKVNIEKIKHGHFTIFLNYGIYSGRILIYLLIIRREMTSLRYFLQLLRTQFEGFFKEILNDLDQVEEFKSQIFSSFNLIIKNLV